MTAEEIRSIRRQTLPNGLTILTEEMEHVRSVSIGVWAKTGSRHEEAEASGISHFVEHMVFKGTTTRSAADIARQIDSIGGNMDAFTSKEYICFNAKVLDEHLPIAFDVVSDMVLNPVFDSQEITRERGVVLEEIKMDEDNPDYLVHEIFTQNFWRGHPLGQPILGTKETVRRFEQPLLREYFQKHFTPGNLIVSVAGHFDRQQLVELVSRRFEHLKTPRNGFHQDPPKTSARIIMRNKKELEQVQICLGVPAHPIAHEQRYASAVLNTLLGGGMSSRLFQNIREQQGLAYSIFSELSPYRDTGCLSVYAGTSLESTSRVVESVLGEFRELKTNLIPEDELRRAKDQLKGGLMLGLESTTARMSNLARQEMYFDRFFGLDEILEGIERVTAGDLQGLAQEFFRPEAVALTVLGNLEDLKLSRDELVC